jgi:hypothetical protein
MPSLKTQRHQEALIARLYEELTQIRIDNPDRPLEVAQERKKRSALTTNGRLNILTADYAARRVVRAAHDELAMANRQDLLTRIIRLLSADVVDGVMSTMDVLEDLLVLHDLMRAHGGPAFLDNKLLIASLNRGGLAGSVWEMDDPLTGPSAEVCKKWRLDGVKVLLRICDNDKNSVKTLQYCADVITQCSRLRLPVFVEPLPVVHDQEKGYQILRDAESLAKTVGVASALGESSRYIWLKLPVCADFHIVAEATSLPILLIAGDLKGSDTKQFLKNIREGFSAGHNVRGTMMGKDVLFPSEADPVTIATLVNEIVQKGPKLTD